MTPPEILPIASDASVARAVAVLRRGGLVVLPTDTVYGLAAALDDPAALRRIYDVKGRSEAKPLPVLLGDPESLALVTADPSPAVVGLGRRFWPGPLTLALPARPGLPRAVIAADGTVGVRVPDHSAARRLIAAAGGALAVTSANRAGEPPATSAGEAVEQLGATVDLILDGGTSPGGLASTVVVVEDRGPRIVREGPIPIQDLETAWQEALGAIGDRADGRV